MLTYLEHVGIVSIFEKEIAAAEQECSIAEKNAGPTDGQKRSEYQQIQLAVVSECKARIRALRWSLDQVKKIKHEY